MLLPAHPGHDNSRFSPLPYVIPRRDGQTLRHYLRAADDARADFVLLTSWNEWPESTVLAGRKYSQGTNRRSAWTLWRNKAI
jgi:hypothetical protein